MLPAEFRSDFLRVCFAKDQRYLHSFFNLFFDMFIRAELNWYLNTFWCTVIRVTEGAFELAFDNKFLALTFDHLCFHTVTACSLTATHQINGFSVSKVELKLAERTFEERRSEGVHNYIR